VAQQVDPEDTGGGCQRGKHRFPAGHRPGEAVNQEQSGRIGVTVGYDVQVNWRYSVSRT
jgi:hypothetical protein